MVRVPAARRRGWLWAATAGPTMAAHCEVRWTKAAPSGPPMRRVTPGSESASRRGATSSPGRLSGRHVTRTGLPCRQPPASPPVSPAVLGRKRGTRCPFSCPRRVGRASCRAPLVGTTRAGGEVGGGGFDDEVGRGRGRDGAGGGEDGLARREVVEEGLAAGVVELGEDVVQQQDGRLAQRLPHHPVPGQA